MDQSKTHQRNLYTFPFCPKCRTFLPPGHKACPRCGEPILPEAYRPLPGQPLWQARLGFPVKGALAGDDLVIFWGGKRSVSGALAALERHTSAVRWKVAVPHAVEGGVTFKDGRLFFGTTGFFEDGALLCVDARGGHVCWEQNLPSGVWSAPWVEGGQGLVGLRNGELRSFNLGTGDISAPVFAFRQPGRVWLAAASWWIVALSGSGEIMALDERTLRPAWPRSLDVRDRVTSPPLTVGEKVFFGTEKGALFVLDVRHRRTREFVSGLGKVKAAPQTDGSLLLVGDTAHVLHAFDLASGRKGRWHNDTFEHRIVTQPAVEDGLVAVTANGGEVVLLEAESGTAVWRYPLWVPPHGDLLSQPLFDGGVVYVGAYDGRVVALPWHLGNYAWAGQWLEAREKCLEAGHAYALVWSGAQPAVKKQWLDKAVRCWLQSEHSEWAAYLLESDLDAEPEQIAVSYEQAGTYLAHQRPRQAVDFLLEAVRWYTEAGQEGLAKRCRRKASRLTRGPHLHITPVSIPTTWQQEVAFAVVIQVQNLGESPARDIRMRFSGALHVSVKVPFQELLPGRWAEVEVPLALHQSGRLVLVVEAFYQNKGGQEFSTSQRFEIEVNPFEGIVIEKDAMVGLLSLDELPKQVIIRGDVGTFRVKPEPLTRQVQTEVTFTRPEPPAGLFGESRELIRVVTIEDAYFTVPAGYWAIFLADEAAIGRFSPGRYERKTFSPLRGKWRAPRPVWKAVLFTAASFRLAYRLGPFRTKEGVRVGVECGLTVVFDQSRPYETWQGILGHKDILTTKDLAAWMKEEISGVVEAWVAQQSEAALSPAFAHREEVVLTLQELLRETAVHFGVQVVDPMYYLNFINPQREKVDNLREAVYWQEEIKRAAGPEIDLP